MDQRSTHPSLRQESVPQTAATAPRERIPLSEVRNPLLRSGLAIWTSAKGDRLMPKRAQMNPRALAGILRNTALVRCLDGTREFQFRIVGDAIVQAKGSSFQGLTCADIDERVPGYGTILRDAYRVVCAERAPAAWRGSFERIPDARAYFQESLTLPLGDDGETVDHLLVMGVYAEKYQHTPR